MPDPAFGEGIELPTPPEAPVTNGHPSPAVVQTPVSRALAEQLAAAGLNIPNDWNDQTIADNLVALQEKADKAAQYEAELETFRAHQAQAAAQAAAAAQPKPNETLAQAAARQRRYEKVLLNRELLNHVVEDPSGRGYAPRDKYSGADIRAAEELNNAWAKRQKISNDFVDDPYGTAQELVQDLLDAQRTQFEERIKALETQLTPVQEQMALTAEQRTVQQFSETHKDKLFKADGTSTPIGDLVADLYYDLGVPLDKALATAEKRLGTPAPVLPAKPATISRAAPTAPPRDQRFIATVDPQRLLNKPDSGVPPTGRMNDRADLVKKWTQLRRN